MGQEMQERLFGTGDAGYTLSDSRCKIHSMRQRMQETLYWIAEARDTL